MIGQSPGSIGKRPLLVVHGHRDGNAVGGGAAISAECIARVRAAEAAARRYHVKLVLFCGAGAPGHSSEARQMATIWHAPPVRGFLDERGADTAENAREALAWFDALSASALIVVSSWWHLRLMGYYSGRAFRDVPVYHVRTRRCDRLARHLAHELRYASRVWRLRRSTARTRAVAPPLESQRPLVVPTAAAPITASIGQISGRPTHQAAGSAR